ncbi:MAG TPA: ankyrin repeat domain-containing protein, partial [Polyangiaceae bacterium]|nr:ankyrin repeat domain-containing protein [Polyangiaceae bacterium]
EGEGGVERNPAHQHARALAELLLDHGAEPNEAQGLYNTIFTPDDDWLKLLLSRGLKQGQMVNWESPGTLSTIDFQLCYAAKKGLLERVRLLLAHHAHPDAVDPYDHRPAFVNAQRNGHEQVVVLLAQAGAQSRLTPDDELYIALRNDDFSAAERALHTHPDLAQEVESFKAWAAQGKIRALELYLSHGADVNARGRFGATALHQAALCGHNETVEWLLARGAALGLRDTTYDGTAVGWANAGDHTALVQTLLDRSQDVFELAHFGRVVQLERLLEHAPQAALRVRYDDRTPLDVIDDSTPERQRVEQLLRAHNAQKSPDGINDQDVVSAINLRDAEDARKWAAQAEIHPHRAPFRALFSATLKARVPRPRRILELGSGPGWLAERLLTDLELDEYICFDFSEPMHTLARARLGDRDNVTYILGTFKAHSWPAALRGPFEAIVAQQSVHELRHKSHHLALYERILPLLAPAGLLLISDGSPKRDAEREHALYATVLEQQSKLEQAGYKHVQVLETMGHMYLIAAERPGLS